MNHFQVAVPLGTMPLQLVCISDGSVAFVRTQDFKTIVENAPGEIPAMFDNEGFTIGGESYTYNTKIFYKGSESLLQWLQAQKLEIPTFH